MATTWTDTKTALPTTIQAAFDSLPVQGGVVKLDNQYNGNGMYTISNRLQMPPKSTLDLNMATLTISNNFGVPTPTNAVSGTEGEVIITNKNANAGGLSNFVTVDTDIQVINGIIDGNGSNQARKVHGILFQRVKNPSVKDVTVQNCGQLNPATHTITSEVLGDKESAGIWFRHCLDGFILNIRSFATDGIITSLCKRMGIDHIIGTAGTSECVYVSSSISVTVNDVTVYDNESCGVFAGDDVNIGSADIVVTNCTIDRTIKADTNPNWFSPGYSLSRVKGLRMVNCVAKNCYGYGFSFYNCDDFIIQNCRAFDNNSSNSASGDANISIGGNGTDLQTNSGLVENCTLYETRSVKLMNYGIKVTGTQINGLTVKKVNIKNALLDGILHSPSNGNNASFLDNDISLCGRNGAWVNTGVASKGHNFGFNRMYNNGQHGCYAINVSDSIFTSNEFYNNKQGGVSGNGLVLGGTCLYNSITNNLTYDNQGSPTQSIGIVEADNTDFSTISGNKTRGNINGGFFASLSAAIHSSRTNNDGFSKKYDRTLSVMYNSNAGAVSRGFAVVFRAGDTIGEQFINSTTAGDPLIVGIINDTSIPAATLGNVCTYGRFPGAKVNGAIVAGAFLSLAGANQRLKTAVAGETVIAKALGANAAGDADMDIEIINPRLI